MSFDSDESDINFIPEVEIENAQQRAAVREKSNFQATKTTYSLTSRGAIAEYPAAREHKLLAPAVPQWPKKVMQLS